MNSVSKMTLGVALALGASAMIPAAPAAAQSSFAGLTLSKAERDALLTVDTAIRARNYPAATAALAAASTTVTSPEVRHYLPQFQYQIAVATNDYRMQADVIEQMIAAGRMPAASIPALHGQLGTLAYNHLSDYRRAEAAFAAQVQAAPSSVEALTNLVRVKRTLKKPQEALPLLTRAIAAQRATGGTVPEGWYKVALDMAFTGKAAPQAAAVGHDLVTAYPARQNWRDALLIYRELQASDPALSLDAYRLMRASKALGGERDYLEMAAALNQAGFPGEAKEVVEEGVAARMIDAGKGNAKDFLTGANTRITKEKAGLAALQTRAMAAATGEAALKAGDTVYGYGEHAKAATLYQAALQKGGVDADLANSRLAMALAMAGQKAEAEAAFRAVTGARAGLAAYWLAWLNQRG